MGLMYLNASMIHKEFKEELPTYSEYVDMFMYETEGESRIPSYFRPFKRHRHRLD